ncbi:hypothetical protein HK405_002195, partial [Cladochytrium tenue]
CDWRHRRYRYRGSSGRCSGHPTSPQRRTGRQGRHAALCCWIWQCRRWRWRWRRIRAARPVFAVGGGCGCGNPVLDARRVRQLWHESTCRVAGGFGRIPGGVGGDTCDGGRAAAGGCGTIHRRFVVSPGRLLCLGISRRGGIWCCTPVRSRRLQRDAGGGPAGPERRTAAVPRIVDRPGPASRGGEEADTGQQHPLL